MSISVYQDDSGRILALSLSDLSGNSGWITAEETALTAHTGAQLDDMLNGLTNADGVALYEFRDGFAERRSEEAISADAPNAPRQPSEGERLDTLEAESLATMEAVAEVYEMIVGGGM